MRPFTYTRAADAPGAVRAIGAGRTALPPTAAPVQFLAGGTTIVDLMKTGAMAPDGLVDIADLAPRHGGIEAGPQGLRLGALATMSAAASHPAVLQGYPVIAQALQQAASAQLRNMATLGGNVLQRTRCSYFRDPSWTACNKREPGSGCAAIGGVNRKHAVLGVSERCIASYPGDFAVALIALDAGVDILGPGGARHIAFADLHRAPGETPQVETALKPGDLITGFTVPASSAARRSLYLKVRDRQSYEFALASAAVALETDKDGTVTAVRIGLGGVASKPWRAHEAEAVLTGKPIDEANARAAAEAAFAGAAVHGDNAYKVELGKRTLVRALMRAKTMEA